MPDMQSPSSGATNCFHHKTDNDSVTPMIPMFKRVTDLTADDFSSHSLWTVFYEPEELDMLANLGFDKERTIEALDAIGYDDAFAFPVPEEGVHHSFKYLMMAITLTTRNGTSLRGYLSRSSTTVIYAGRRFVFNRAAKDRYVSDAQALEASLEGEDPFPITVRVPLLATTYELNRSPD